MKANNAYIRAQNGFLAWKAIFYMFCTQIQKIKNFDPTFDYIMLRNFGTVWPFLRK